MHICLISPYSLPSKESSHGGIGSFTKFYIELLNNKGYRVTLIEYGKFNNKRSEKQFGKLKIIKLKSPNSIIFNWFFNSLRLNREISKEHKICPIDIVETAELGLAFVFKKRKINYVIRLHGGHHFFSKSEKRKINWWSGFKEKISFKKADAFIGVSKYVKEHTENYLSFNNKPLIILPSPIDSNKFLNNKKSINKNKIIFAGRLCEKKGIANLILSMPKVKEFYPDIELHIFGKDSLIKESRTSYKGFLDRNILSKIKNNSSYIFFNEEISQNQLIGELSSSIVCVFPSFMETQGLIALEAMSLNKLVVFTKYGPGKELISHRLNGVLCDSFDSNSIADEIIWCLNLNSFDRNIIEEKARETITNNYDPIEFIENNIKFYKSLK